MGKKYFTAQEANALLPSLRISLRDLQAIRSRFESKYRELALLRHQGVELRDGEDPFFSLECELEFMRMEASAIAHGLNLQGVEVKDVESGLVDFPAKIEGREVLLCWRLGEERVEYYHGLHDGFQGRRRLTGGEIYG
ncbi:DUF2203 domain-containing protein [Gorillibacterium sp. sgz5001074]|uniref:DUF2203 domain-containing protein n=1 Tax=Gorillibacterium sp. sgz5001074 TaxID=3446695 RepID=UPI003F667E86